MENLKLFGIYIGSIALFSVIAYILSLNTVKQSIPNVAPLLPKSFSTTTVAIIKGPDISPKATTTPAVVETNASSTSTTTSTTTYISFLVWPPNVQTIEKEYSCATEEKKIGEQTFCVTNVQNEVDKKIINQYTYSTASGTSTKTFSFSTQKVGCDTLEDSVKESCIVEQNKFNIEDSILRFLKI
jgi:hypothetical protein